MENATLLINENDRLRLELLLEGSQARAREPGGLLDALAVNLEQAVPVKPAEVPADVVTMNSTVAIRDVVTDEREIFTLTYPEQADYDAGRLSVLAPLGRTLLGRRIGEVVDVPAPAGLTRFRIEAVIFQPERAGAYDL